MSTNTNRGAKRCVPHPKQTKHRLRDPKEFVSRVPDKRVGEVVDIRGEGGGQSRMRLSRLNDQQNTPVRSCSSRGSSSRSRRAAATLTSCRTSPLYRAGV